MNPLFFLNRKCAKFGIILGNVSAKMNNMKEIVRKEGTALLAGFVMMNLINCTKSDTMPARENQALKQQQQQKIEDSLRREAERVKYTYFLFPKNKKDSAMAVFKEKFSDSEQYTVFALNRLDKKNSWRADSLIIPDKFADDFLQYSPFPKTLDSLKQVDKMVFFSYAMHAYALYEGGSLIKWGPSSMGKKATPTKKGLMFANWKKEEAISTSNSEWILRWNFNIHNTLGVGWHQYDLPGHHASHSCLRLLEEDAKWMYSWADTWILKDGGQTLAAKGTPVIVFGESDFKSRPWLKLPSDPAANEISETDLNRVFVPYLPEILKEQQNAKSLRNKSLSAAKKEADIIPRA